MDARPIFELLVVTFIASLCHSPCLVNVKERFDEDLDSVLTKDQWRALDRSVDTALHWLASQQELDGSFRRQDVGQPTVTSLAVPAFLSRSHLPGHGQYGQQLERAIEYILS